MNWETIKFIYRQVLIHKNKIEYLGEDKYRLTSFHSSGKKWWTREYKNEQLHGKYISWDPLGRRYINIKLQNGKQIK